MKAVAMQIAVWILRFSYLFFMPNKLKNRITIISRQANKPTIDLKLLSEELSNRGDEVIVLSKKLDKSMTGGIEYAFHMVKQMYYISTSKVLVLDGYCILASVLPKKEGQRIVQMWHALGAVKKFGHQTVGKASGNSKAVCKVMCLHRNYDWIIAPSQITGKFFAEAFDVSENNIKLLGLPRIDYIVDQDRKIIDRMEESYSQLKDKPTVLYAPTFRKNLSVNMDDLISNFNFAKYNLVIKKHWLDKTDYSKFEKSGAIVDRKYSSLDWLKVSRKVITDYSAIILEAAILRKEIYLFFYDISEYKEGVGMNVDFSQETLSRYSYANAKTLCVEMNNKYELERVDAFRDKYITVDLTGCTEKLADFIESLIV